MLAPVATSCMKSPVTITSEQKEYVDFGSIILYLQSTFPDALKHFCNWLVTLVKYAKVPICEHANSNKHPVYIVHCDPEAHP